MLQADMVSNFELEELRGNVAIMITAGNALDWVKFETQKGRYFTSRKYGKFQLDSRRKYRDGKTNFYVFDTRMGNPLDVLACKRINEYIDNLGSAGSTITKVDITNPQTQEFLGDHTMKFLDSFQYTDNPTVIHGMVKAVRGEKPLKESGNALLFPWSPKNKLGLFFIDNKFLRLVPVRIVNEGEKVYAVNKYGTFDVTDKEARYTWGNSLFFFFAISTADMPEKEQRKWRKVAKKEGVTIDADKKQKKGKEENENPYRKVVKSPAPPAVSEAPTLPKNVSQPAQKEITIPKAVNMSAFNYMSEFSPYEPIIVYEKINHAHYQKRMFDLATKAPTKKQMNIMTIMIVMLVVVIAWQNFVNPQLSKLQTSLERQQTANNNAPQQQQPPPGSNQTGSNSNNNGGGGTISGNNPIPNR